MNNDTYVKKYIRKDGTEVKNHFRTEANHTDTDNYTAKGNVNPYTDEKGTKEPLDDAKSTEGG
ncbi:hypothetical protein Syn7502_01489 [Synechococcus sp. PCC 7502]|uniref:hypothetical protein n=1 Tax=Synechococcus sp. PCC 7502 TaxID=1173263 RepID=UPI00029FDD0A|nr:hypothetical protein [Synechococcus sp. PCC 7502]AFY73557.1 hypothetical protein Syn7502_01489 [Synechococcus sp. PCC 7502]